MHNVSSKLSAMSFLTLFVISTGNQSLYFNVLHNGNSNKIRNTTISLEQFCYLMLLKPVAQYIHCHIHVGMDKSIANR